MKHIAATLGGKKDAHGFIAVPYSDRADALYGWIRKTGQRGRHRDRWFLLMEDNYLYYFDDSTAVFARGAVFLQQATFVKVAMLPGRAVLCLLTCALPQEDALLTASLRAPLAVTVTKAGLELHRDRVYELEFKSTVERVTICMCACVLC